MKLKIAKAIIYTTLAVLVIGASTLVYWTFEADDVLTVKNQPVPVRPKEINPEATVILSPNVCKNLPVPGIIRRTLVSKSSKILLPDYYNNFPVGCNNRDLAVIIPGQTPDDVYHLEFDVTYVINPLKTVVEHWYTQDFTVKHDPPLVIGKTSVTTSGTTGNSGSVPSSGSVTSRSESNAPSAVQSNNPPSQPTIGERIMTTINGLRDKIESIKL